MSNSSADNLLSRLARRGDGGDEDNPWTAVAATQPKPTAPEGELADETDAKLAELMRRINSLTETGEPAAPEHPAARAAPAAPVADAAPSEPRLDEFIPREPGSFAEAGVTETEVEGLILKFLLSRGDAVGRDIADQVKLPFAVVDELLRQMKFDQLLVYRGSAPLNDYIYQLTDLGRERARRLVLHCTYFGSAPVSLTEYVASVKAQSLENQHPTPQDLQRAFHDLLINPKMLARLGPAINSGRGMFLYGAPGNGKTSIAKRVTRAFGQHIWIPRSIGIDGEIVRLFDPMNHEEAPPDKAGGLLDQVKIDERWVRIRRPTIAVGGELTMEHLEVTLNSSTGISEAPMQLKSNCGTLVIDDFGRQRIRIDELLNRWIVPLEERVDFLTLPNGKTIQVPFDQLIIFSTNLEPRELVDEAFLRRIPYKIEVHDPSEAEFRQLFQTVCDSLGFQYRDDPVDYLIATHYQGAGRPFRCCHPRDLLSQVRNYCLYQKCEQELTPDVFDFAVDNYFAVL
jgi:predicted ATPase with chaperone activity